MAAARLSIARFTVFSSGSGRPDRQTAPPADPAVRAAGGPAGRAPAMSQSAVGQRASGWATCVTPNIHTVPACPGGAAPSGTDGTLAPDRPPPPSSL